MLKGKELGLAIAKAINLKITSGAIATKTEVARHFGIKPPSLYGWINRGAIAKDKLPELFSYFSDVAGPEHWGLTENNPFSFDNEKSEDDDLLNFLGIKKSSLDFDQIEIIRAVMSVKKEDRPDLKKIVKKYVDSDKKRRDKEVGE